MNIRLLDKAEDFENLKRNDMLLVAWSENFTEHTPGAKKIMFYNIWRNLKANNEIICQKKNNHYFNWKLYLEKKSAAVEVYKVDLDLIYASKTCKQECARRLSRGLR